MAQGEAMAQGDDGAPDHCTSFYERGASSESSRTRKLGVVSESCELRVGELRVVRSQHRLRVVSSNSYDLKAMRLRNGNRNENVKSTF